MKFKIKGQIEEPVAEISLSKDGGVFSPGSILVEVAGIAVLRIAVLRIAENGKLYSLYLSETEKEKLQNVGMGVEGRTVKII